MADDTTELSAILAACYRALARCGFIRYEEFSIDWPLDGEFHCWVRINLRRSGQVYEAEPLVGIHAVAIEQLWTRLKTGPYRSAYRREFATVATPLYAIVGLEDPLVFEDNRRDRDNMRRLVALYRDSGLAFARAMASYDALAPALRLRAAALGGNPERLVACLYLMGRTDEALEANDRFERERPGYFEGFAEPFRSMVARRRSLSGR